MQMQQVLGLVIALLGLTACEAKIRPRIQIGPQMPDAKPMVAAQPEIATTMRAALPALQPRSQNSRTVWQHSGECIEIAVPREAFATSDTFQIVAIKGLALDGESIEDLVVEGSTSYIDGFQDELWDVRSAGDQVMFRFFRPFDAAWRNKLRYGKNHLVLFFDDRSSGGSLARDVVLRDFSVRGFALSSSEEGAEHTLRASIRWIAPSRVAAGDSIVTTGIYDLVTSR